MKPRGNKIDAMPLFGDSESGGCRPGPNLQDRRIQIQEEQEEFQIQKFQEEHTIQLEMMYEAMVPRVPNLPPEPSARQIAEHELTGHAVF